VQRVKVKWPNDVVVDLRKIAGLLVETSGEMQGPSVAVIGVGLNYRLPERVIDQIDQPVTDVASCSGETPSRSALLAALLRELAAVLSTFERSGFASFREPWLEMHAYHGHRVHVIPGREAAFDADVTDVGADGALHVRVDDGRTVPLASAEISLRRR
jgi:BirA family biotin operon repressor/biotin-[acetyl-CoA-carboxylase] ligase